MYLTVDFITKLPLVIEKNAILVFCGNNKRDIGRRLVWLFRDNIWKLHKLSESVISDRKLQFVAELIKELNKMLGIEIKLLTSFHLQTDEQTE